MASFFLLAFAVLVVSIRAEGSDLKQLGDVCGNRNPCAPGLDCVLTGFRKRCFPVSCLAQAATTSFAQTNFDLEGYGEQMMATAGITTESDMFRTFPSFLDNMNLMNTKSTDMTKFLDTVKDNKPPLQLLDKSFQNCTGFTEGPTSPGQSWFYGASWELGLCLTYNGDVTWAQRINETEPEVATLNNCFGAVLGLDAAVGGLIGIAFTGSPTDLQQGCKQMFPIISIPPLSLQIGFIDCADPIWIIEITAGLSGSFGLPGYTSCTTTPL